MSLNIKRNVKQNVKRKRNTTRVKKKYLTHPISSAKKRSANIIYDFNMFLRKKNIYVDPSFINAKKHWKLLGEGGFAFVYKAQNTQNKGIIAIKQIKGSQYKNKLDYMLRAIKKELIIMMKINKINDLFPVLYGAFARGTNVYIVMEYIEGNELWDFYSNDTKFDSLTPQRIQSILCRLIQGVRLLHDNGIAHMDIKLENILYNENTNTVKLMDYGLSCAMQITKWTKNMDEFILSMCYRQGIRGTPPYISPEIWLYRDKYFTNKMFMSNDVWSIGIVAFMLFAGFYPFYDERKIDDLINSILLDKIDYKNVEFKDKTTQTHINMIKDMLMKSYKYRKTTTQLTRKYC